MKHDDWVKYLLTLFLMAVSNDCWSATCEILDEDRSQTSAYMKVLGIYVLTVRQEFYEFWV